MKSTENPNRDRKINAGAGVGVCVCVKDGVDYMPPVCSACEIVCL